MTKYLMTLLLISSSLAAFAGARENSAKVTPLPAAGATPENLCEDDAEDSICKSPMKLAFKWSNDGKLAANTSVITRLSQKAIVSSVNGKDKYTIEVVPQYSKMQSKNGVYMKLRLLVNDELVAAPEIFAAIGQQADVQIQNSPQFVGIKSLELSAFSEVIR